MDWRQGLDVQCQRSICRQDIVENERFEGCESVMVSVADVGGESSVQVTMIEERWRYA